MNSSRLDRSKNRQERKLRKQTRCSNRGFLLTWRVKHKRFPSTNTIWRVKHYNLRNRPIFFSLRGKMMQPNAGKIEAYYEWFVHVSYSQVHHILGTLCLFREFQCTMLLVCTYAIQGLFAEMRCLKILFRCSRNKNGFKKGNLIDQARSI